MIATSPRRSVSEQLRQKPLSRNEGPESLPAALEEISAASRSLESHFALPESDRDIGRMFDLFVLISSTAMLAASEFLLPQLEEGKEG